MKNKMSSPISLSSHINFFHGSQDTMILFELDFGELRYRAITGNTKPAELFPEWVEIISFKN